MTAGSAHLKRDVTNRDPKFGFSTRAHVSLRQAGEDSSVLSRVRSTLSDGTEKQIKSVETRDGELLHYLI